MPKHTQKAPDMYKSIECGYQFVADGFGAIATSGLFPKLLAQFANYHKFLRNRNLHINSDKLVSHLSHGTNVIYASHRDEILSGNRKGMRNFIVALRIDHLMLPDVEDFLRRLSLIIEQTADFFITIGAGYTTDEFRGRVMKMGEIFHSLREKGLNPIRIILHGGGTFEEQRNNPYFGQLSLSTYEIIYCKLDRHKLK